MDFINTVSSGVAAAGAFIAARSFYYQLRYGNGYRGYETAIVPAVVIFALFLGIAVGRAT